MALEVTIYRYKKNKNYANPNDPNSFTPVTPAVFVENTTNIVTINKELDIQTPRAKSRPLTAGDNIVTYSAAFPEGRSFVVWIYTYDSNGYQVGHYLTSEPDETGFTINVPKDCTLKYIATIEN